MDIRGGAPSEGSRKTSINIMLSIIPGLEKSANLKIYVDDPVWRLIEEAGEDVACNEATAGSDNG